MLPASALTQMGVVSPGPVFAEQWWKTGSAWVGSGPGWLDGGIRSQPVGWWDWILAGWKAGSDPGWWDQVLAGWMVGLVPGWWDQVLASWMVGSDLAGRQVG